MRHVRPYTMYTRVSLPHLFDLRVGVIVIHRKRGHGSVCHPFRQAEGGYNRRARQGLRAHVECVCVCVLRAQCLKSYWRDDPIQLGPIPNQTRFWST